MAALVNWNPEEVWGVDLPPPLPSPHPDERWREVPHTEYEYLVSSYGRVVKWRRGRWVECHQSKHKKGYRQVSIRPWLELRGHNREFVHRLVAYAFLDLKFGSPLTVDHQNRERADNRVANLLVCTQLRNNQLAWERGERKQPTRKLTDEQAAEIIERYAAGGVTQKELGREFGLAHQTIGKVTRRERYKNVHGGTV